MGSNKDCCLLSPVIFQRDMFDKVPICVFAVSMRSRGSLGASDYRCYLRVVFEVVCILLHTLQSIQETRQKHPPIARPAPQVVQYLAGCGLQSCAMLVSKGYPDLGWNPVEGERYLNFLRFAVFCNGTFTTGSS